MKVSDLYGFQCDDIDQIRSVIESGLGISMEPRESSYRCGDYFLCVNAAGQRLALQQNFDEENQEWAEDDFKDCYVLLYVDSSGETTALRELLLSKIPAARLLRRKVLTDDNEYLSIDIIDGKEIIVIKRQL